jgi:CheY-like chemotaxis protein
MKTLLFVHDLQASPTPRVQYLEIAGYKVIALASATEALRAISQNRPDMVLTDVLVEGMNGFQLCAEVRKHADAVQLPVVIFSGIYRGRSYREEAYNVGAQEFLASPVNLDEMVTAVQRLFTQESAERLAG